MMNLLRVPPEVEVDGLDGPSTAGHPRAGVRLGEDLVIEPDGVTRTPAAQSPSRGIRGLVI